MTRGVMAWPRRVSMATVLIMAALMMGPADSPTSQQCHAHCERAGAVRWIRPLPGAWLAQGGLTGTTPAHGQAFAALGAQAAVVGSGLTVSAYATGSGQRLWADNLARFPAGSAIVSVAAWPGVVTVGVALPSADGSSPAAAAGSRWEEVVLRGTTGRWLRAYPAAAFGGAVAASPGETVIVGVRAVTGYSNRTGRVLWTRSTGSAPQSWQVAGGRLYVTVSAEGYLGAAPVTALRRIDLRTGQQRLVRPPGRTFAGALSLAFDGVVLFSDARGVTAYSEATGAQLWRRPGALPDTVDAVADRIYLIDGSQLVGVNPVTGVVLARVPDAAAAALSGLYAVQEGTVLGLDHGALGKAWGYSVAAQQVVWTSRPLPWPHFFVDSSGIGGSAPAGADAVLLAICGRLGPPLPGGTGQRCSRPELVLLNR